MKVKLGEICEIVSGSTPKTNVPEYWNGELKWITPAELNDDSYIITDSVRKITSLGAQKTGLSPFPEGTVILSSRAPIGKVAIAGCEMYCNQGFKNLICSEKIDNRYLYWYLKGHTEYLNSLGRGATFKEISKQIVSGIEINVPDRKAQEYAVCILEKLSQLIQLRKQELQMLDEFTKARFVEMFGDLISKGEIAPLNKCLASVTGGGTPSMKHPEYYGGDIPFIKSGDVKTDWIFKGMLSLTELALKETNAKIVPENAIIVVVRSAALLHEFHIGIAGNPLVINQDLKALIPTSDYNPLYLMWAIRMKENQILGRVQTMLTSHIRMEDFLELTVPKPSMKYQDDFAAFVTQVDKSKAAVQVALDKTQLLFDNLMQQYFG